MLEILAVRGDHLARQRNELLATLPGHTVSLGDLDQLADHVRPAQLLLEDVEEVIAGIAVGDRKPAEVLADQRLGGLLARPSRLLCKALLVC